MKWMPPRFPKIPWRYWRWGVQSAFLIFFLWLFRKTELNAGGELTGPVNLFFRLDPLVAASAILGAKMIVMSLWVALITIGLTLLLGRIFCGWICPLGTLLDAFRWLIPRRWRKDSRQCCDQTGSSKSRPFLRSTKYVLLVIILVGAVVGLPLVGFFDPFSLLMRGLTFAVDPATNYGITATFTWLYLHAPESVARISEPFYAFLKANILPFKQTAFLLAGISFAILVIIFALEFVQRRFWCRNLCPLGAMLGLFSRFSLLRRFPLSVCKGCGAAADCSEMCRMDAFNESEQFAPESCNLCLDCLDACPSRLVTFNTRRSARLAPAPLEPSRRVFLASIAAGLATPLLHRLLQRDHSIDAQLIRPPGALTEEQFTSACVKCGLCMKVCPTNALQPTFWESGLAGMFSPRLVPRIGYCEYNCTLCGEVCPTNAIAALTLQQKRRVVIGKAVFDRGICLPYAKNEPCIVCEEHCPVPGKAIRFDEKNFINAWGETVVLKQPYVVIDLCIGCGICENKCPLEGKAAVRVSRPEAFTATPIPYLMESRTSD